VEHQKSLGRHVIMHVGMIAGLKVKYPGTKVIDPKERDKAFVLIFGYAHGVIDIGKLHKSSKQDAQIKLRAFSGLMSTGVLEWWNSGMMGPECNIPTFHFVRAPRL
jgi:hypothetical protein